MKELKNLSNENIYYLVYSTKDNIEYGVLKPKQTLLIKKVNL